MTQNGSLQEFEVRFCLKFILAMPKAFNLNGQKSLIFAKFVAYNEFQGLPPFLFQRGQEVLCTALNQWGIVPATDLRMIGKNKRFLGVANRGNL